MKDLVIERAKAAKDELQDSELLTEKVKKIVYFQRNNKEIL